VTTLGAAGRNREPVDQSAPGGPTSFTYEVRLGGRLSRTLRAEFEDLGLAANDRPVETVLHGSVVDQAALHGLLRRIEALGLELVEVRRVPPTPDRNTC
jgi:hypothetical protein